MVSITIDLRSHFGAARNQGKRGTCLGFAASDLNRAANTLSEELSVEYAFHFAAKLVPGWALDQGVTITAITTSLATEQQPSEAQYPYQPQNPSAPLSPPPFGLTPKYGQAPRARGITLEAIEHELTDLVPTLVVIRITQSFFKPINGVIATETAYLQNVNHAVLIVGVGKNSITNEKMFLIRNSWGTKWGDAGHAWISIEYLKLHLIDSFIY